MHCASSAGLAPAGVHVDDELDVAVRVGRVGRAHAVDRAAQLADEGLALVARQAGDGVAQDALDIDARAP